MLAIFASGTETLNNNKKSPKLMEKCMKVASYVSLARSYQMAYKTLL
jgi:hypothetical protein